MLHVRLFPGQSLAFHFFQRLGKPFPAITNRSSIIIIRIKMVLHNPLSACMKLQFPKMHRDGSFPVVYAKHRDSWQLSCRSLMTIRRQSSIAACFSAFILIVITQPPLS